ncbi:MAG TPA: arginine--tRNA ligase [Planctomycetota bacterium]|nr:arginine--tRNA ligase [Planctomycetota bacterium]
MNVEELWSDAVRDAARALWGAEIPGPALEPPSDPRFGDAATSVPLRLARSLKRPPRELAEALAAELRRRGLPGLARVEAAGAGFVNLAASAEFYHGELRRILEEGPRYGRSALGGGRRVLVEHCSANPTGPLHIAHGRQAAVGDSLANILDFAGFRVTREFYVNDTGNQIEMLGRSLLWRLTDAPEPPDPNCYRGDYVKALARELAAQGGPVDLERAKRFGKDRLLEEIRRDLEAFRVRYDVWTSEEALHKSGKVEEVLNFFESWGLTYRKDGAVYLKTSEYGDTEDRPIVKTDGSYVYRLPDMAYHRDKFQRGFDILVDLWGPDHHAHIATMRAGLKMLNFNLVAPDQVRPSPSDTPETRPVAFEVLIVQHCRLLEGGREIKMSKRAASYVTLRELLDEVGVDAARFFFVMRKASSPLDFDLDVARRQSLDNPVYYAQYAHARIGSIYRKGIEEGKVDPADLRDGLWAGRFDPARIGPDEIELLKTARAFRRRVELAARDLDPAVIADFLRELSGAFQRYYEYGNRDASRRVLHDDEEVRRARLAASAAVQQVLRNGFGLLGLSAPERM